MPNKNIGTNALIDRVRLREQGADPATPSGGFGYLYIKSDGKLYYIDDAGLVNGPLGEVERYFTLTIAGDLTVDPGVLRVYNLTGASLTISKVHIAVDTAPTGAAILVDVNENGTTIFTNQANRPTIAISGFTGDTTTIDAATWEDGNHLQADVDQIGSTIAGSDLTITIVAS